MKKMKILLSAVLFWGLLGSALLHAQEIGGSDEDPAHDELRTLRDGLFDAYEKRDLKGVLSHVHRDVIVTWQNGEINHGREELRAFYERMMVGENRIVESVQSKLTVDDLSILYGDDTAIAFGSLEDDFKLTEGAEFNLRSRWTATMVKEGNQWLVAAFHVSANLFDNPLLTTAKNALYTIGGIALAVGIGLGAIVMLIIAKARRPTAH
jgi:uncharacterized protein (TIGR02246 family)